MGVDKLLLALASHATVVTNWFHHCQGHAVGVDASVWLHAFVAVNYIDVLNGEYSSVIKGVVDRVKKMKARGVYCL